MTETVTYMETGEPVRDTRYGAFAQHAVSGGIWYSEATWPRSLLVIALLRMGMRVHCDAVEFIVLLHLPLSATEIMQTC